jgi:ABC-type polysaccharide/polyol phosphate export permease
MQTNAHAIRGFRALFANMNLRLKLWLSFGLFIFILCGLGLMAIVTMRAAADDVTRLSGSTAPGRLRHAVRR